MNKALANNPKDWRSIQLSLQNQVPGDMVLQNVRLPQAVVDNPLLPVVSDGLVAADLCIEKNGVKLSPPSQQPAPGGINMGMAMVWPCTIDCHSHIDKGQTWPRIAAGDGTFQYAIDHAGMAVHHYSNETDQRQRSEFMLRTAYAHGCIALRSPVDSNRENFDFRFGVLAELAKDWADRMTIQLCPLTWNEDDAAWVDELAKWKDARNWARFGLCDFRSSSYVFWERKETISPRRIA